MPTYRIGAPSPWDLRPSRPACLYASLCGSTGLLLSCAMPTGRNAATQVPPEDPPASEDTLGLGREPSGVPTPLLSRDGYLAREMAPRSVYTLDREDPAMDCEGPRPRIGSRPRCFRHCGRDVALAAVLWPPLHFRDQGRDYYRAIYYVHFFVRLRGGRCAPSARHGWASCVCGECQSRGHGEISCLVETVG